MKQRRSGFADVFPSLLCLAGTQFSQALCLFPFNKTQSQHKASHSKLRYILMIRLTVTLLVTRCYLYAH